VSSCGSLLVFLMVVMADGGDALVFDVCKKWRER
jgi:hypothetical protein